MKPFFAILIAQLICLGPLGAKEDMDMIKANYYYSHLAFYKAIPYYEKLAEKENNVNIYSRLGDCYRLTGSIDKAAGAYRKALDMPKYGDLVMLRYAQMEMMLMQYEEAAKWLQVYKDNNPRDRRVANLIAGCKSARDVWAAAPKKAATLLSFNTDHSEFAPAIWNGNLVFAADTAIKLHKKKSNWTGAACYNIYALTCDGTGNCGDDYHTLGTSKNMDIAFHDGPATFSSDGDTMYFTRTRFNEKFFSRGSVMNKDSIVVLETMMATDYDESLQKFRTVKPFTFNNTNFSVAHATVSPNGRMMIFSSTMEGAGSDLYLCTRNPKGKWLRPKNLGAFINTEGEEVFPYFANDTTLIFASDGLAGLGGLDIYVAHWDSTLQNFAHAVNAGVPINSSYDDISMALYPDGSGGYFSSNRPAEFKSDNIYFYRKD
ncbi:MAG: tetratricopeptide repeat protein [Bacteroidota bacterium]